MQGAVCVSYIKQKQHFICKRSKVIWYEKINMYTNKTAEEWESIAGTTDSYSKSTM